MSTIGDDGGPASDLQFSEQLSKAVESLRLERALDSIWDSVRYRIIYPAESMVEAASGLLDEFADRGHSVGFVANWWVEGNPYKGLTFGLLAPITNFKFEVQLHTDESAALSEANHALYEILRDSAQPLKARQAAFDSMAASFAVIPHPPGIDSIGEPVVATRPAPNPQEELLSALGAIADEVGGQLSVDDPTFRRDLRALMKEGRRATPYRSAVRSAAGDALDSADPKDPAARIRDLETALGSMRREESASAAVQLGWLYLDNGDVRRAHEAFRQARDSGQPGVEAEGALGVGLVLADQEDAAGARDAFASAASSSDQDCAAVAWLSLGELLAETGDAPGAHAAFERVVGSGHEPAAAAAAVRLLALNIAEHVAALQRVIDGGDRDRAPEAAFELALFLTDEEDLDGAKRAYAFVVDSGHPDQAPGAAVNLGNLLSEAGDLSGAQHAYQKAIDSGNPDVVPSAAVNLGGLLAAHGDFAGARAILDLAINSDDALQCHFANQILADLERSEAQR